MIAKDILFWLLIAGAVYIAASSPYFVINLKRDFEKWRKYKGRRMRDTFKRLQSQGAIAIRQENHQIYISLTAKGRRMAGWLQIDALKVNKPKKWDGKWRILIFDIPQLKRTHREALRGKLKELGFCSLQKSVWIHPFNCQDEIGLLRDFFELKEEEMRLIIAHDIGKDEQIRTFYKI